MSADAYADFDCLRVDCEAGVATVTLDHPPINLLDLPLLIELDRLARALEADETLRVVIFRSANPEFFIAHADVSLILEMPQGAAPKDELPFFHEMVERFRHLPMASIAMLEGRARGGGSEFLLSLDMRFGALGRAIVGQPEVALGILPGGSGTQRLPRLMGRGRALEAILGCGDFDADLAERYGWLDRALPADELEGFVETLARRIASFPKEAIALAKRAVDADDDAVRAGLLAETRCFDETLGVDEARRRMARFLDVGGQTREGELALEDLFDRLAPDRT